MSEWIKINHHLPVREQRLPTVLEDVLIVTDKGNIFIAYVDEGYGGFSNFDVWFDIREVTYWTYLPELPEEYKERCDYD